MNKDWLVKTTNSAEDFERILNELERDYYRVNFVAALESGQFIAVARLEK